MPQPTFRKEWQVMKKVLTASGVDITTVTKDKPGFGKALDLYQDALEKLKTAEAGGDFDVIEKCGKTAAKVGKSTIKAGKGYIKVITLASSDLSKKVTSHTATPDEIKAEKAVTLISEKLGKLLAEVVKFHAIYVEK